MLHKATHYVTNDEPCFNLAEENFVSPEDGKWHRYEILLVVRNDDLAEYRRDMGLRSKFKNKQRPEGFRIIGGIKDGNTRFIEETVGSLRQMASQLREKPSFNKDELPELSMWQDAKKARNKTVFS